nr:copia protein [Tanacetum cinerariifolium]
MIRNKARLDAQGHIQEEGIDYDKVFAHVARIKAIRLFLAYASFEDFVVYLMDVKSAFLYEKIKEEVYVCQPSGFEDPYFLNKVYKVKKILYGLYQDPRECKMEYLSAKNASTPMETQKPLLKDEDVKEVDVHMYRSMIGSLMYLTSLRPDIMFAVCAYARYQVNPKVSHLYVVKRIFSDYAGASLDRKSTTRGCQYLGSRLISWQCKKQTVVANSTREAEYFWSTAKMKTINGEGHIHAKVDGKKTKKHRKPRRKVIEVPQPSDPIEVVVDEAVYKELDDKLTRSERVSKLYNDSLLATCNTLQSNVDSMKLNELMELCTTLQSKVLELEKIKTTQALEINSLKRRVKKLEKKQSSRTHKLKRLYKVGLIARVKSSNDNEDLVNDQDDEQMFDVNDLQGEVFVQEEVADKEVNNAGEVTAASIATTDSATATMTVDEVTLAQA